MAEGHGDSRRAVMHNDFVLVGPPADPADVRGEVSVAKAFTRIARREAPFVSRGDESGTHRKEQAVWQQAGIQPGGSWYIRAGAGMGPVLRMASEKRAYALADRGTFLAQRQQLDLALLVEGDPLLANPYHVIVVAPDRRPRGHHQAARQFADFLLDPRSQETIRKFGTDRYGQPLFFPDALGAGSERGRRG
jgi:tungstate transport system substrate-binding protein